MGYAVLGALGCQGAGKTTVLARLGGADAAGQDEEAAEAEAATEAGTEGAAPRRGAAERAEAGPGPGVAAVFNPAERLLLLDPQPALAPALLAARLVTPLLLHE